MALHLDRPKNCIAQVGLSKQAAAKDRQTLHALQFFAVNTVPQLSGYFDSPFWQRTLQQIGQNQPAVKHAVVAIGALHEKLLSDACETHSDEKRQTEFALEQCNMSIQCLTKQVDGMKSPDLRVLLTSCVLFTCFEAMQGHCEQALDHASRGYGLLKQYETKLANDLGEAGDFGAELDQLCSMIQRVHAQAKCVAESKWQPEADLAIADMPKPVHFETLRDARSSLEPVINWLSPLYLDLDLNDELYGVVCSNSDAFLSFGPWLIAWEEAFSKILVRRQATLSPKEREGAMALKAHHLVCVILSNVDLSAGEAGWDQFHQEFTAIVDLATATLEGNQPTEPVPPTAKTELCFNLSIADPLHEVCARCRDPALRRRALDLLACHFKQNCMWSSWSAWKVDKYLMQLEEDDSHDSSLGARHVKAPRIKIPEPSVDGDEETGCSMYDRIHPYRRPREALNPGLLAGGTMGRSQDAELAHSALGINFLDHLRTTS